MEVDEVERTFKVVASNLGFTRIKNEQLNVVRSFVAGNDVFAVLPTGFGKTLCFANLPGVFDMLLDCVDSVIVVVSPPTSIMKDQVCIIISLWY